MPAWGAEGRRSAQRPADPEPHRLPQSIQLTPKQAQAEVKKELAKTMKEKNPTCVERAGRGEGQAAGEQGQGLRQHHGRHVELPERLEDRGRGPVQPRLQRRLRRRRLLLRSLPHQGLVVRTRRQTDGGGAFGPPLTRRDVDQFPGAILGVTRPRPTSCASAPSRASSTDRNGQGTGRMPGFCSSPPEEKADPLASGEVGVITPNAGRHREVRAA